jgi:PD-(D/E)XK nuclease superfamily
VEANKTVPAEVEMILIDRSRILSYQACPRRRYLEYHFAGTGIQRKAKALPLVFGSAFHEGSELMLKGNIEGAVLRAQLFLSNVFEERSVGFDREEMPDVAAAMQYGMEEQAALAEALLRGFWAYEGESFLEGFEVLAVEEEGRAALSDALTLMFRPDALVREKSTGDLYVVSWKTCSTFGPSTTRQARVDMQSLSEVFGVQSSSPDPECPTCQGTGSADSGGFTPWGEAIFVHCGCRAKVEGVLYKFAVKGQRRKDNWDGLYKQSSHLIYGWAKLDTLKTEFPEWSWSYEYPSEADPNKMSRLGKGWQKKPIWRDYPGGVKAWIEGLAKQEIFPRHQNALAASFPSALPVSRRVDEIETWRRQVIAQETRIATWLEGYGDGPTSLTALDYTFPQYTHSCEQYSGCSMHDVCWVPAVAADPVGSGLYQIRTSTNHPEHSGGSDE